MSWKHKAESLWFNEHESWNNITYALLYFFPGSGFDQAKQTIRSHIRNTERYKQEHQKDIDINKPVGVFSDPHIPFDHPEYLPFIIDTFKQFNVGQVVCGGDLVDYHAISRFQSEPCAMSSYDELEASIIKVKEFTKAFPKVKMCQGNHDDIPKRQAATLGIGSRFLKSFSELLELPKGWQIQEEFIIDGVLYKHGLNCCGKDGAMNTAIQEQISTIIGHSHAFGGCKYMANKRNIIFGMNVGCGIDISKYAFAYGKYAKFRPTLGCGIVFSSTYAIFVPMGQKYLDMKG